jgi:hypothetical protein
MFVSSADILLESFHDNQAYFTTIVSYTFKTVLEIEHTLPGYTHKLQLYPNNHACKQCRYFTQIVS